MIVYLLKDAGSEEFQADYGVYSTLEQMRPVIVKEAHKRWGVAAPNCMEGLDCYSSDFCIDEDARKNHCEGCPARLTEEQYQERLKELRQRFAEGYLDNLLVEKWDIPSPEDDPETYEGALEFYYFSSCMGRVHTIAELYGEEIYTSPVTEGVNATYPYKPRE